MMIFLALKLSDVSILLINVKMPTLVGILTFINRINFSCSIEVSMKKFYNLETRFIQVYSARQLLRLASLEQLDLVCSYFQITIQLVSRRM